MMNEGMGSIEVAIARLQNDRTCSAAMDIARIQERMRCMSVVASWIKFYQNNGGSDHVTVRVLEGIAREVAMLPPDVRTEGLV